MLVISPYLFDDNGKDDLNRRRLFYIEKKILLPPILDRLFPIFPRRILCV